MITRRPRDLRDNQVKGYKDILKYKTLCNTADCGGGKTATGYTAVAALMKRRPNRDFKTLVVSTPKGVSNAWSDQYKEWTHLRHLKVTPLIGTPAKRVKLLQEDADIHVVSWGMLGWLREATDINYHFVIGDEAECLKGVDGVWRGHLQKLSTKARYKYLLSATPKSREEDDYWGLALYLDGGKALGATIGEFRDEYMRSYAVQNRQLWKVKKEKIPQLLNAIKHLFVDYELHDEAKIPVKTITCNRSLKPNSLAKYKLLQKQQCVNGVLETKGHAPLSSLAISSKLDQLSSGFLYVDQNVRVSMKTLRRATNLKKLVKDNTKVIPVDIFKDRINALKRLVRKVHRRHGKGKNLCICYKFKYELEQLQKLYPDGVSDKEPDIEKRWNKGEIKYLFLQYSRSARALNLQQGGHIMIFYSLTFKWADSYQIVKRLARQGQQEPLVYCYRLYFKETIDQAKTKSLGERFKGHITFQKMIRSA